MFQTPSFKELSVIRFFYLSTIMEILGMVVNNPLIRPAISWGAGWQVALGGLPLEFYETSGFSW